MNKAFIFDLDGVLIDDELIWESRKQRMYGQLFGDVVHKKMGSTLGVNIEGIFNKASEAGADISYNKFEHEFFKLAGDIYATAPIPDGTQELFKKLKNLKFRIGVVSASPLSWIMDVLKRLDNTDDIEIIISLHDRPDLEHKPHPAGYKEAMRALEAAPENTYILEDSNSGIKSAKASGAYTIGLKQNLVEGYVQTGADAYAKNMKEVIQILEKSVSA